MILLDTHAWIWWLSNPSHLSALAKERIDRELASGKALVSSMSVWEACLLHKQGRLSFTVSFETWLAKCEALPFFSFLPVSNAIAVRSVTLPGEFHKDPADRIIVSTAQITDSVLISKDAKIRAYPHIKTVW